MKEAEEARMTIKVTPKTEFNLAEIPEFTYYELEFKRSMKPDIFKLIANLSQEAGFIISPEHEYDTIHQTYLLGFLEALDINFPFLEQAIEDSIREHYAPEDIATAKLLVKVYDGKYEIEKLEA